MQTVLEPVVIKGTRHGLLVSVREDADLGQALDYLRDKLAGDAGLLKGASLSLDLGWREMEEAEFAALEAVLQAHAVKLEGVLSTSLNTRNLAEKRGFKAIIGRLGLAQHQGRALRREPRPPMPEPEPVRLHEKRSPARPKAAPAPPPPRPAPAEPVPDSDQEETLYLKRTLRSGQKAMYPGTIIVMGDVNPGAEIEAEGDVIVLGHLRGRVHAGCTGNANAQVYAFGMQPTQLRIADQVWEGAFDAKRAKVAVSLKATLRGGEICLEPMLIRERV